MNDRGRFLLPPDLAATVHRNPRCAAVGAGGFRLLVLACALLIPGGVARAECGNSWSWDDLLGVAPDGGFVVRSRSYGSMGQLDRNAMDERFALRGPDGVLRGELIRCTPDEMNADRCPPEANGGDAGEDVARAPRWRVVGQAPAELVQGNPRPESVAVALAKRLDLSPAKESALRVGVNGAFVRVGRATVKVLPGHDVFDNVVVRTVPWSGRLFEHAATPLVFLELRGRSFYSAYGTTCGWERRALEWLPRVRTQASDIDALFAACRAEANYPSIELSRKRAIDPPDGSLACLVDLHDERMLTKLPEIEDREAGLTAAAHLAAETSHRPLAVLVESAEMAQRVFGYRALARMMNVLAAPRQPASRRRKLGVELGRLCLSRVALERGEALDAGLECVTAVQSSIPTAALEAARAAATEAKLRTALEEILQSRGVEESPR